MREPNISRAKLSFSTDIFQIESLWQVWRRFWTHSNKFMCIYLRRCRRRRRRHRAYLSMKPHNKNETQQTAEEGDKAQGAKEWRAGAGEKSK